LRLGLGLSLLLWSLPGCLAFHFHFHAARDTRHAKARAPLVSPCRPQTPATCCGVGLEAMEQMEEERGLLLHGSLGCLGKK